MTLKKESPSHTFVPVRDELGIGAGQSQPPQAPPAMPAIRKHSHYYKQVRHLETIDVYRVLDLYKVTDSCIQHAVKKLLVAGGRGGNKDIRQDIQEAIDTLERWKEMQNENALVIPDNLVSRRGDGQ